MGDFDCSKPADGTPLLTCCQPGPIGPPKECTGTTKRKAIVLQQQFFLHVPSCTMYRKQEQKIATYNQADYRDRIVTTTFQWKTGVVTRDITNTTPIPVYENNLSCANNPYELRSNASCSPGAESFRIQCYTDLTPPNAGYDYTITFSESFTRNDFLAAANELMTYMASNFDTAEDVVGFRSDGSIGNQQHLVGGRVPECGTDPTTGLDWNPDYGAFAGLEHTLQTSFPLGYEGQFVGSKSTCFAFGTLYLIAWFSKVNLSKDFQVETFAVRTVIPPPLCSQLAPMNALAEKVCDFVETKQFSTGTGPTIFGPRDFLPHYSRILCR